MIIFLSKHVYPRRRAYHVYGRTSPSMALQLLFLWVGRTYGDKRYQILVFVAYLHIGHILYTKMRHGTNVQ